MPPNNSYFNVERICKAAFWTAIFNFAAFDLLSLFMGGTAHNGKVESGRYFLGDHGVYLEVSKMIFDRMHTYETCTFFLHFVGMIAAFALIVMRWTSV
jgi:hypothetical protein